MSDKRREPRNACYLRAEIYTGKDPAPLVAEAHDISDSGMRLKVPEAKTLPNTFRVSIPRRRLVEEVEVRRRAENEVGVVIHKLR